MNPLDFLPDSSPFWIYLGVFLGPFVQEDAAVLAAATLSATKMFKTIPLLLAIYAGLILSDIWKYWIGWAALRNNKAQAFAEKKHIAGMKDKVQQHPMMTLLTARFIPLARIPIYVACGFFKVSYPKFCLYVAFTGFLYIAAIFALCHGLGVLLGEKVIWVLPILATLLLVSFVLIRAVLDRKKST